MFTVDSFVNESVQNFKAWCEYVPNASLKRELCSMAEAQGAYTKAVFAFGKNVTETAVKEFKVTDWLSK